MSLSPVGVEEGHSLLREGALGNLREILEGCRVELLGEGLAAGGGALERGIRLLAGGLIK